MVVRSGAASINIFNNNPVLFKLTDGNMQSTSDQQFSKIFSGTNYFISDIVARRKTGAFSVTCIGGIYTAASKGGQAIVSAIQTWNNLSGPEKMQIATLAGILGTEIRTETPYLSLTTGNLIALTADIYIYGMAVD